MDYSTLSTFITSVGIPGALVFILAYVIYKIQIMHSEEMKEIREALNNNTLAIQHLTDMITRGGEADDNSDEADYNDN